MRDLFDRMYKDKGPLGKWAQVAEGYFAFPKLEGSISNRMKFNGKEVITWSVNDYLGLANIDEVRKIDAEAAKKYGSAYPMGARLMSGHTELHEKLQNELAKFVKKEAAYVLNFGYQGILSTIDSLQYFETNGEFCRVNDQNPKDLKYNSKLSPFHLAIPVHDLQLCREFYSNLLGLVEGRCDEKWVEFNRKYSELWPVIITQKDPLPEAEQRDGETGKLEKYFSENPGEGGQLLGLKLFLFIFQTFCQLSPM